MFYANNIFGNQIDKILAIILLKCLKSSAFSYECSIECLLVVTAND